jgi:hypothetical protein
MGEAIHSFGLVRDLQEELRNLLQENEGLFAPPRTLVLSENIGDIESEITKAVGSLNTGGGIVIIRNPVPTTADPRKPFMFGVTIQIDCVEKSIVNRSVSGNQVWGERLGEMVFNIVQNYQPTSNGWTPLIRTTWQTGKNERGDLVDNVTFSTETVYDTTTVE